jgi:hypothetical protein
MPFITIRGSASRPGGCHQYVKVARSQGSMALAEERNKGH